MNKQSRGVFIQWNMAQQLKKKKEHTENMQKPEGVIQKHYVE